MATDCLQSSQLPMMASDCIHHRGHQVRLEAALVMPASLPTSASQQRTAHEALLIVAALLQPLGTVLEERRAPLREIREIKIPSEGPDWRPGQRESRGSSTAVPHELPHEIPQASSRQLQAAMRLGLLPQSATADREDVVEGLEPVFGLLPDGSPLWCSHFGWFRWFASGDLVVLTIGVLVGAFV